MANDLKTSAENTRSPIDGTELVRLATSGANWKATLSAIWAWFQTQTPSWSAGVKFGGNYGWETIGTASPSAVASVAFTGLSAYRSLRLTVFGLLPATNSTLLYLRTSTNNGSSYDAGASDYDWALFVSANTPGTAAAGSTGSTFLELINLASNATNMGVSGVWHLHDFNQSKYCNVQGVGVVNYNGTNIQMTMSGGRRVSTTARDALQLLFSSGNVAGGFVVLEGLRG